MLTMQSQERAQFQEYSWKFVIFNFSEEQMKQAAGPTAKSHKLKAFAPFIARVFPIQSFNLSHFHFLNIGQMIEADWQRLNNLKRWKRPSEGSQMLVVSLRNWPPLSLLLFWLLPRSWRKTSVKNQLMEMNLYQNTLFCHHRLVFFLRIYFLTKWADLKGHSGTS